MVIVALDSDQPYVYTSENDIAIKVEKKFYQLLVVPVPKN
jgi:hypothetical protein